MYVVHDGVVHVALNASSIHKKETEMCTLHVVLNIFSRLK